MDGCANRASAVGGMVLVDPAPASLLVITTLRAAIAACRRVRIFAVEVAERDGELDDECEQRRVGAKNPI